MKEIEKNGSGLIIYLNQEGRGIGLTNKLRAYALQDQGHDTYEANQMLGFAPDDRNYDVAAAIFKELISFCAVKPISKAPGTQITSISSSWIPN